ncbi:hypothetical protein MMC17_000162 [Xylographa soralifera]|nr:hypothetical protein [Xylographa soralifera]
MEKGSDDMEEASLMGRRKGSDAFKTNFGESQKQASDAKPYRSLRVLLALGTFMLFLNAIVLMAILVKPHTFNVGIRGASAASKLTQGFVPEFGFKTMNFGDDNDDYNLASTAEGNAMWEERFWMSVPSGWGYHIVPNPRQYGLPPSEPVRNSTAGDEIYLTTYGHQLHCLGVLREALLSEKGRQSEYHIFHCLEKLRRSIICSADTTSEAGTMERTIDGRLHWSFDDWKQPHQCRDWDAVMSWMQEHDGRPEKA